MDNVDEFRAFIYALGKNTKETSAREYSLGKLIKDLKNLNPNLVVKIDDGTFPMKSKVRYAETYIEGKEAGEYHFEYNKETNSVFNSWTGGYCVGLSMNYSEENQNIIVKDLLDMAEFINDKYLCGSKGENFFMDLKTPIHIANYETRGELKLIGVKEENGKAILITRKDNDDD